jgi:hypothetical protein
LRLVAPHVPARDAYGQELAPQNDLDFNGSATLEATQGQIDGFFSQFPYEYHQNRMAYVGD